MLKAVEYLTCAASVALFAAFWKFAQGDATPAGARAHVRAGAAAWTGHLVDWFRLPDGYAFHPGHAWAKRELPSVALVGMDDFAQQLVGPLRGIDLPRRGETIRAGQHAMRLRADSKTVDMLAPISGTVLAVNELIEAKPQLANEDPYGRGWLYAVKLNPARDGFDVLIGGATARAWMEQVTHELEMTFTPELGHVLQDGGHPVDGFAQAIDHARWDRVAKKFLLTAVLLGAALWAGNVSAQSLPKLPKEIRLERSSDSPGQVTFDHATHVDSSKPNCTVCHSQQFNILKASARRPITHENFDHGRQCGACHDGRKAFKIDDDCTNCHRS